VPGDVAAVEPSNGDFQARLARAGKIQLLIVATTAIVGCVIGLIVGLIDHSVAWGILALLAAGVAFFLLGSVMFLTLGGYGWLRRRRDGPGAS
jgi:hypothetical protein